jgi:two-component system, NtrC family, sensor kinase
MHPSEDRASFWTRLFRCQTVESAERELRELRGLDPELARIAWQAHRAIAERAESSLSARARELEMMQSFGRSLAEARSLRELLDRSAASLHALADADAVAFASALPYASGVELHLARALTSYDAGRLGEAVALGFVPLEPAEVAVRSLPAFDRFQGARPALTETDILVVPVMRRGRDVLHLAVVPRLGGSERCTRLVFGASNHLAVHIDRLLSVAESEQGRFGAILDSMPHAVVLADMAFEVASANVAAERLLPRLGADVSAALRSVGDLDLVGLAYDVLAGRSSEAEGEAILPDGGCLEVSIAPWRDGAGATAGLVIVMLDVTTARRLREQVAQSEKLSSLGRMIAGVAHELNNPLTSVIGYAQLLRTMPPGPKFALRLETIRKEADRCRRIVHNLLRFARVHTPERKPLSLNEVIENATQLLAYAIRSAGCRVVCDLDRTLPSIVGDAHDVEQALVNLLTNATQAMAAAERPGAITLTTCRGDGGSVVLLVDDDGPGIPADLRPKLFDPFFTTKREGQGTGLGLWLVYNAVTAHFGSITASASPSGGARFRLEFPEGPPVKERAANESSDAFDAGPRVSARILVVDAEAALAELICETLAAEGHRTVASHDADDAVRRLADESFDLVVSDAELPGLSGDRLAREVARIRPALSRAILLTTGDPVSREPEAVARRVNADLLRKPFELDELRRMVRTRLNRNAEH